MIRAPAATCLSILLFSATSFAQNEFEGLDLSEQGQQKEAEDAQKKKKQEESKPFEDIRSDTPLTPSGQVEPDTGKKPVKLVEGDTQQLERNITQEDRVKSVQRKLYLKKQRFELSPYVFATINDPYYAKVGVGGRLAYYLADTMAIAGKFSLMQAVASDEKRMANRTLQAEIFVSEPNWSAMGDFEWSPIYGKVSIFNSILHFDAFIAGGLGVVRAATSALPNRGLYFASDIGVGMRFVVKDYMAVNASLMNTSYVDQPTGTTKGVTQNMLTLGVGLSLFIPFRSTSRESE